MKAHDEAVSGMEHKTSINIANSYAYVASCKCGWLKEFPSPAMSAYDRAYCAVIKHVHAKGGILTERETLELDKFPEDSAPEPLSGSGEPTSARLSIGDLERILNADADTPIQILPNGEIVAADGSQVKPLTMRENLGGEYGSSASDGEMGDGREILGSMYLAVDCPKCLEKSGNRCRDDNGLSMGFFPHGARVNKARALTKAADAGMVDEQWVKERYPEAYCDYDDGQCSAAIVVELGCAGTYPKVIPEEVERLAWEDARRRLTPEAAAEPETRNYDPNMIEQRFKETASDDAHIPMFSRFEMAHIMDHWKNSQSAADYWREKSAASPAPALKAQEDCITYNAVYGTVREGAHPELGVVYVRESAPDLASLAKKLALALQGMVDNIREHASPRNQRLYPLKGSRYSDAVDALAEAKKAGCA